MNIDASINFPVGSKLILIQDFFPADLANNINAVFGLPRDQWSQESAFAHCPGRLSYTLDHPVRGEIDNHAIQMQEFIGQAIDCKVQYQDHSIWLDIPGYRIAPHKDTKGCPEISVQIYMGDRELVWEMLGFCVYTEQHQALFEAHYRVNAGYICLHPHLINHGLNHHIPPQYVRNSVYMRYCKL